MLFEEMEYSQRRSYKSRRRSSCKKKISTQPKVLEFQDVKFSFVVKGKSAFEPISVPRKQTFLIVTQL